MIRERKQKLIEHRLIRLSQNNYEKQVFVYNYMNLIGFI